MANSVFVQLQLDIQTAAAMVLPAKNIVIGEVELLANGDFWQHIADVGYVMVIGMPKASVDLYSLNGDFDLVCELFYPRPADVSSDFIDVNNTIGKLIDAWVDYGPWTKGRNRSPKTVSFAKPEIRTHEKPCGKFLGRESFIVCTKFTMTMPLIASQAAEPYVTNSGVQGPPVFPQGTP